MTAIEWKILGAALIIAGVLLLVVSQLLLSRSRRKLLDEL